MSTRVFTVGKDGSLKQESGPALPSRDPGLAKSLREQRMAASQTDSDYWRRKPKTIGQICEETPPYGAMLVTKLKQNGVKNVNLNATYEPLGADKVGDPTHYFEPSHGRKDWEKRVKAKQSSFVPKPDKPLGEDLITQEMVQRMKKDPSLRSKKRELREQVIEDHGPRKIVPKDTIL